MGRHYPIADCRTLFFGRKTANNGGGVEPDDLKKLGQRFYRPAGQNEKGSGLGLSIVMRIAELHGLKVRLENVTENEERIGLRAIILV